MRRCRQTRLQDGKETTNIAGPKLRRLQPKTRKNQAAQNPLVISDDFMIRPERQVNQLTCCS